MKDDGGPAFPFDEVVIMESGKLKGTHQKEWQMGMSLRDYFAGMALQTCVSKEYMEVLSAEQIAEMIAEGCYRIADAMLEERGRDDS